MYLSHWYLHQIPNIMKINSTAILFIMAWEGLSWSQYKFCKYRGSTTVLICEKFIVIVFILMKNKQIYLNQIWNVMEILWVDWAPGWELQVVPGDLFHKKFVS